MHLVNASICQAGLSTFQSGPKETKMVKLSVFDHLGLFLAHMDPFGPFQTKMIFLLQMDKVGFGKGASEQNINCVTQLKLDTVEKLSSSIFCCLSGIGVTRPNLHVFQYIQAYKPFADPIQYIKA